MDESRSWFSPNDSVWENEADRALKYVSSLAKIENSALFIKMMKIEMQNAWAARNDVQGRVVKSKAEKHIDDLIRAIDECNSAAVKMLSHPPMENNDAVRHQHVAAAFFRAFAQGNVEADIANNREEFHRLRTAAVKAKEKINEVFSDRGPRKGAARDVRFSAFAKSFRVFVDESHGHLTISRSRKSGKYEGTLMTAWDSLKFCLPPAFKTASGAILEKIWQNPKVRQ